MSTPVLVPSVALVDIQGKASPLYGVLVNGKLVASSDTDESSSERLQPVAAAMADALGVTLANVVYHARPDDSWGDIIAELALAELLPGSLAKFNIGFTAIDGKGDTMTESVPILARSFPEAVNILVEQYSGNEFQIVLVDHCPAMSSRSSLIHISSNSIFLVPQTVLPVTIDIGAAKLHLSVTPEQIGVTIQSKLDEGHTATAKLAHICES